MKLVRLVFASAAILAALALTGQSLTALAATSAPEKAQCPQGETLNPSTQGSTVYLLCSGGSRAFVPSPTGGITFTATCPGSEQPIIGNSNQGSLKGVAVTCPGGSAPTVNAQGTGTDTQAGSNPGGQSNSGTAGQPAGSTVDCGGTQVAVNVDCQGTDNPIYAYLRGIIKFLSGAIGLAVVLSLFIGGIQYGASAGNPQAVAKAKSRITNAILGLILFIFMVTILNYLIPGGILK